MLPVSWSILRIVGNSKIAKSTILIPIVGYLILFNDTIFNYIELDEKITINSDDNPFQIFSLSTKSRLILIYFGLCAIALGMIAYAIFCPEPVKNYNSSIDYVSDVRVNIGPRLFKRIALELSENENTRDELRYIEESYRQLKAKGEAAEHRAREMYDRNLLDLHYDVNNYRFSFVRMFIALSYGIGFIFLAIPSMMIFLQVFGSMFSN